MAIKAVLFDLDGTLWAMPPPRVDWSTVTAAQSHALEPHFQRLGFNCETAEFVSRFFAALNGTLSPPTPDHSEPSWYPVLARVLGEFGEQCGRSDASLILDVLNAVPSFPELGISAFPDSAPTLEALRNAGIRIGAVTNNPKPPHILSGHARSLGLPEAFDVVVSSWELGWRKPHSIPFMTALDALGVTASEAVHVGDSIENDIQPAIALGMMAVLRSAGPKGGVPKSYHTVTSLLELPEILGLTANS